MIKLYHVGKTYGERDALRDVNVHVERGEFVYITGASGAGKSTFLRMLYGAEAPSTGKLLISGQNVTRLARDRMPFLRRNVGVIHQDFKLLLDRRVGDNVALTLEVIGAPRDQIRRRVPAVLNLVGLKGREDARVAELSGGEQQRVAIARAIVNDPAVLLADEPTGNLDGAMAVEVMEILHAINLRGTTVLVATHDVGLMERFPKRRLRLEGGRVLEARPRTPGPGRFEAGNSA